MSELCFCLWYYLTAAQTIAGLSARAYVLEGDDDTKSGVLRALSGHDFKVCESAGVPASIMQLYPRGVPYSIVRDLGVEQVFAEELSRIAATLPPHIKVPEDKLFFATPLFDFGSGFVPAEIGDGYIRER